MSVITQFITADGQTYLLDSPMLKNRVVLQEEAYGMPEIEYVTQRGPFQHGETLVDYFLKPRVIQLLVRHKYCSEQGYWDGRANILDILRPNRGLIRGGIRPISSIGPISLTWAPVPRSSGILRKIFPNGQKRDLDVHIESGPGFAPHRSGWDEYAYEEALRFVAHNPVWYDPVQKSIVLSPMAEELVFPATFSIVFGSTSSSHGYISYAGTWEEYPRIVIYGPITNPTVTNETTGEKISFVFTVNPGDSIDINLSYSVKSATLRGGTINMLPYITTDSDLTTFHIHPGYNNHILVSGEVLPHWYPFGGVTVYWHDRYIGV